MPKPLYIKNCKAKGRGVFCKERILKDEVIESAPLIIIPASQKDRIMQSKLADYFFNYTEEEEALALALGFGSLYNHAEKCNAGYSIDHDNKQIDFYALQQIAANTEICINYGGAYGKSYSEWFLTRNISYKK